MDSFSKERLPAAITWHYRGWKLLLRLSVSFRIYGHAGPGKDFYGFYERFFAAGYRFCPIGMSNPNRFGESPMTHRRWAIRKLSKSVNPDRWRSLS